MDRVVGTEKIKVDHLRELKYIDAVLRETLRLHPTVPAFARAVRPESPDPVPTLGKGEFALDKDKVIIALVGKAQRDPAVFGEDADEFRPERMLDGGFENLPSGAWKVNTIFVIILSRHVLTVQSLLELVSEAALDEPLPGKKLCWLWL